MMKKMHWFTLALTSALLTSILFTSFASARPQTKTYTVNSDVGDADANPGDGLCATSGGQCTLNAAIQEANADGDSSTITFAQQFQSPNFIAGRHALHSSGKHADWKTLGNSAWESIVRIL